MGAFVYKDVFGGSSNLVKKIYLAIIAPINLISVKFSNHVTCKYEW